MRKLLRVNSATPTTDTALLIARLGIAALMFVHGIPKMLMLFSGAPLQFPSVMGMRAELSLSLTVFAEVVCSVFLLAGFATRLATVPLIITMLVAVFVIHGADPFAKQEPALYYLLVCVWCCSLQEVAGTPLTTYYKARELPLAIQATRFRIRHLPIYPSKNKENESSVNRCIRVCRKTI